MLTGGSSTWITWITAAVPRSLESVEDKANYTFIRGDVCNSRLLNHIFNTENIDVIFHLAAKTHVESSFETPSTFQRVNIDGTRVLLAAAHQARHQPQLFIYVSTDEVYGASLDEVFDESSPGEALQPVLCNQSSCRVPAPSREPSPSPATSCSSTTPVTAFLLVLEKGTVGEIYNVGTGREIPIMQLARELIKMVKNVPEPEVNDWLEFVPDRPSVDLRYPIKCEKLQQLGWRAQVSWHEGIRQTVKWYRDNPNFWSDAAEDEGPIRGGLEQSADKAAPS
ncbi:dTDP-D-glucose 4,6-dehydratase [Larimichthys crocea]|uniref:Uncharacterized protein n=1 Tax=Larimichthys crocea TaxID=215358 RepID=A0ACD3QWV7_LARCR|nr:dTDP-D-glucose 4,6-dehydratase [Larimichthys crocea]